MKTINSAFFIVIGLILIFLNSCETKETAGEVNQGATTKPSLSDQTDTVAEKHEIEIKFAAPHIEGLPADLLKFVPVDYLVLDTIHGYLNDDDFVDLLLVMKHKYEGESELNGSFPEDRPLLILLQNKIGEYELAARNDHVVLCYNCGGVQGDPYQGITISKGEFLVRHYGGSSWRWTNDITFKYAISRKKWLLDKILGVSFHSIEPEKMDKRELTKKGFRISAIRRL